jgi:3-hydroxyisobutyrate dehydrogenase
MDSESTKNLTVAFLGTGQMGTPMASRLIAAGFNVRVWNRSTQRVQSLVLLGGVAAATPAAAANGADLVVTMLPDGPTIKSVIDGEDGAFSTIGRGAIWLQMGTIGVEWTTRFGGAGDAGGRTLRRCTGIGKRRARDGGRIDYPGQRSFGRPTRRDAGL